MTDADRVTIDQIIRHAFPGATLGSATPVSGGLINTLVRLVASDGASCAVRIYSGDDGRDRCAREANLLEALRGHVALASVVTTSRDHPNVERPFIAYRWIDGVTLNECRRVADALARTDRHLRGSLARDRLGSTTAEAFREQLDRYSPHRRNEPRRCARRQRGSFSFDLPRLRVGQPGPHLICSARASSENGPDHTRRGAASGTVSRFRT